MQILHTYTKYLVYRISAKIANCRYFVSIKYFVYFFMFAAALPIPICIGYVMYKYRVKPFTRALHHWHLYHEYIQFSLLLGAHMQSIIFTHATLYSKYRQLKCKNFLQTISHTKHCLLCLQPYLRFLFNHVPHFRSLYLQHFPLQLPSQRQRTFRISQFFYIYFIFSTHYSHVSFCILVRIIMHTATRHTVKS